MTEEKMIITPAEAESLLLDGPIVHHIMVVGTMMLGRDYQRDEVLAVFAEAKIIEIAGDHAKSIKHPIAVLKVDGNILFFEADMEAVAAFERSRS